MRAIRIAVAALAVALVLPVAAEAHTVTPNVNCSAATLAYESTAGTTLSYEIVVNGVPTVANSFVVPATQLTGTLSVPYSAPAGPFTVTVNAVFSTGERGSVTQSLMCTTPPAPPAAPAPPVTTPAAGGTAPVAQKPAQSVAGTAQSRQVRRRTSPDMHQGYAGGWPRDVVLWSTREPPVGTTKSGCTADAGRSR